VAIANDATEKDAKEEAQTVGFGNAHRFDGLIGW
jgi:hypothetical protein